MMISTLSHNGILVLPSYKGHGLKIRVAQIEFVLTDEQEEMAVAWPKKIGTVYVDDSIFRKNFFKDFQRALGIKGRLKADDFDLSHVIAMVEAEKIAKNALSKEERKMLAQERKKIRELNKEKNGYALVDGEKVEIANYTAEPSCIFMGRGKHPQRGRWKIGPREKDIILNLDKKSPIPPGKWMGRQWHPESLWIAKWRDKLGKRMKYVWIADSAFLKQEREREKYDKARVLEKNIEEVRSLINGHLSSSDIKERKIATVCYLIDRLAFRVGDEKDEDQADTVGASTLRPEHIIFHENDLVEFSFLGKDSVPWNKTEELPKQVIQNLVEFVGMVSANPEKTPLFKGINSSQISSFLDSVMPGLSAKVFRTYHASDVVRKYLKIQLVSQKDSEHKKKKVATLANLEAAKICNHMKQVPKNFKDRVSKQKVRYSKSLERINKLKEKFDLKEKKIQEAKKKAKTAKQKKRVRERVKTQKTQKNLQLTKGKSNSEKIKMRIELMKATSKYNLTTSLKNYIDPRIYRDWGVEVDFPWQKYYSTALQKKFSWLDESCNK